MPRRKKALPRAEYRANVERMLERDRWRCVLCGRRHRLDPHHIVPRSQGGGDELENLVTLCRVDHEKMDGGGWRKARPALLAWTINRRPCRRR